MKHIISLGAGVQSSTMALMAAHGEITPMPDCAIFADTGAEPKAVYEWAAWLEKQLPFPVHTVTAGNLKDDCLKPIRVSKNTGKSYMRSIIPAHIKGGGLLGRSCTRDYKIIPIRRKIKELLGLSKHDRWPHDVVVTQWLGISLDEIQRMKSSVDKWMEFRHPLIDKRMSRNDCLAWMKDNSYLEPPRSACTFCPFHSNYEWTRLDDDELSDAVQFEKDMQKIAQDDEVLRGAPYLHSARIPLLDALKQNEPAQLSFLDECAGMCGV